MGIIDGTNIVSGSIANTGIIATNHNNIVIDYGGDKINIGEAISNLTMQVNTMVDLIDMMIESGNFTQLQQRSFAERLEANKMLHRLSK
jgi:hypothetical protein